MFVGICLVFLLAYARARKSGVSINDLFIIAAFSLLFGLIGAGTLYAFTKYSIKTIIKIILVGKFKLLGGLVFYGGLIFGILGAITGIKISKVKLQIIEASIIPFLPLGHAIGRVGCFLSGCCNGIKYSGLFAVYYPNSVAGLPVNQGYFPVQLLEAFLNILLSISLIFYTKKERKKYNILSLYLLLYATIRFILEFLRGDTLRGIYFGFSTSQWISFFMFAISLFYFLFSFLKSKNRNKNRMHIHFPFRKN